MLSFAFIALCFVSLTHVSNARNCYDEQGNAQSCSPPFMNAAFGRSVEATNTCGQTTPTEYCPLSGWGRNCQTCDAQSPRSSHPPRLMTDFNSFSGATWWQSDTMLDGIRYPVVVNLTLNLDKAYDVSYIRLRFQSPRPQSFAIYKKTTQNGDWIPFQFFSGSCQATYGKDDSAAVTDDQAVCTYDSTDISPLTGGSVAFSPLARRPSMFNFENSPVLQEWVTATAIRITLTRINTFGDEDFGGDQVLKSYYYAISDLQIGARCKCNGHGKECYTPQGQTSEVCRCVHNTDGVDCGKCLPLYNDRPWGRATQTDAKQCQRCGCNNKADRCYFDQDLYQRTGRGGHCIDCRDNTVGPHCERCKDNHFLESAVGRCTPCECNPAGSETQQCDTNGRCQCKPGFAGNKCGRSSTS